MSKPSISCPFPISYGWRFCGDSPDFSGCLCLHLKKRPSDFENFARMGSFWSVFTRSVLLALIATIICLLIGYPLAYALAREGPRLQRIFLMLIMLPMWMNFLLRTYAWMTILENTGSQLDPHPAGTAQYKYHKHTGCGCTGHGIQLPSLHGSADIFGNSQNR